VQDDRAEGPEVQPDDAELAELAQLEREAAALETAAERRGGLTGARRMLLLQAPVLVVLAVVLMVWGRNAPDSAAAAPVAAPPKLGMVDAYLALPSGNADHAYLTIKNNGGSADRLVSVACPWASSVTLTDGSSPTALPWITIPAHSTVVLKPGGYAIALNGLTRTPVPGDPIELDLNFATSGTVYSYAPVGPKTPLTVQQVMDAMKYMGRLPPLSTPSKG